MPDYKTHDPQGWCGDARRGAAMGRSTIKGDPSFSGKLCLRRSYLDNDGYDCNGTYFGHGEPLYWYANEDGTIDGMLRARTRVGARVKVLAVYPKAKVR